MGAHKVSPQRKWARVSLSAVLAALVLVLPLVFSAPAGASSTSQVSQSDEFSVSLDGSSFTFGAPVALPEVALQNVSLMGFSPTSFGAGPVVLGAPVASAPTVLGCWSGFGWACAIGNGIVEVGGNVLNAGCDLMNHMWNSCDRLKECASQAGVAYNEADGFINGVGEFGGVLSKCVKQQFIDAVVDAFMQAVYREGIKGAIASMELAMGSIMVNGYLSDKGHLNPVIDCETATGNSAKQCQEAPGTAKAFIAQVGLMRQLALLMLAPLLMLLVIQSVIRGSLYFLLRAFLIMLPVAVIGTVVVVTMTQLLLNISNDISNAMVATMGDPEGFSKAFKENLKTMDPAFMTIWSLVWIFFLIIAAIAIFVELMLRETGIYLASLFMPLAFAGLVWPGTAKWARRLVELLIALIFSKVVIVAALMLGMSALISSNIGHNDIAYQAPPPAEGQPAPDENQTGFANLFAGASILIMAAFAGGRVMQLTPAAMSHTEKAVQPSRALSQGQVVGIAAGRLSDALGARNKNQGKIG